MEFKKNQLIIAQGKLKTLFLKLKWANNVNHDDFSNVNVETFNWQVNVQKNIVVYLKFNVNESDSKFEKVDKIIIDVHNNLDTRIKHHLEAT